MSDTKAAREAIASVLMGTASILNEHQSLAVTDAILASGLVVTTAEADLRVANMRELAALICDDMLHPEYQFTCRVCRNVQSIRALPLTEEGGPQ